MQQIIPLTFTNKKEPQHIGILCGSFKPKYSLKTIVNSVGKFRQKIFPQSMINISGRLIFVMANQLTNK